MGFGFLISVSSFVALVLEIKFLVTLELFGLEPRIWPEETKPTNMMAVTPFHLSMFSAVVLAVILWSKVVQLAFIYINKLQIGFLSQTQDLLGTLRGSSLKFNLARKHQSSYLFHEPDFPCLIGEYCYGHQLVYLECGFLNTYAEFYWPLEQYGVLANMQNVI